MCGLRIRNYMLLKLIITFYMKRYNFEAVHRMLLEKLLHWFGIYTFSVLGSFSRLRSGKARFQFKHTHSLFNVTFLPCISVSRSQHLSTFLLNDILWFCQSYWALNYWLPPSKSIILRAKSELIFQPCRLVLAENCSSCPLDSI